MAPICPKPSAVSFPPNRAECDYMIDGLPSGKNEAFESAICLARDTGETVGVKFGPESFITPVSPNMATLDALTLHEGIQEALDYRRKGSEEYLEALRLEHRHRPTAAMTETLGMLQHPEVRKGLVQAGDRLMNEARRYYEAFKHSAATGGIPASDLQTRDDYMLNRIAVGRSGGLFPALMPA